MNIRLIVLRVRGVEFAQQSLESRVTAERIKDRVGFDQKEPKCSVVSLLGKLRYPEVFFLSRQHY